MNFLSFANKVMAAGLIPFQCSDCHWQILDGQYLVNFYPDTNRGDRFYVDGALHGSAGSLDKAISAARGDISIPMLNRGKKKPRPQDSVQRPDIRQRWEQHRHSGGKLTLDEFAARVYRREGKAPPQTEFKTSDTRPDLLKAAKQAQRALRDFLTDQSPTLVNLTAAIDAAEKGTHRHDH